MIDYLDEWVDLILLAETQRPTPTPDEGSLPIRVNLPITPVNATNVLSLATNDS